MGSRVYVFPPYFDTRAIGVLTGLRTDFAETVTANDGICPFVFKNQNKVVHHLEYNRKYGDFAGAVDNIELRGEM